MAGAHTLDAPPQNGANAVPGWAVALGGQPVRWRSRYFDTWGPIEFPYIHVHTYDEVF